MSGADHDRRAMWRVVAPVFDPAAAEGPAAPRSAAPATAVVRTARRLGWNEVSVMTERLGMALTFRRGRRGQSTPPRSLAGSSRRKFSRRRAHRREIGP